MSATNMKFSIQPDSIEPVLCIWFDYVHGQEINDQEVYWARDKLIMAKEFEDAIRASLQLDFHPQLNCFTAIQLRMYLFLSSWKHSLIWPVFIPTILIRLLMFLALIQLT